MRKVLVAMGVLALAASAHAGGKSALTAVQTAKAAAGRGTLVEISGEHGDPNPQDWKLVYNDPEARGGVKEVIVSGGSVESIRTPLRGYTGVGTEPAILSSRLNLDSGGAFDVAEKEAVKRKLSFNWADYTLRANSVTGAPFWVVRLFDHMGAQVGVIQVSGEDGSIVAPLEVSTQTHNYENTAQSPAEKKIGGVIGTVGNAVGGALNKAKDSTLRAVGTVQEVLTGDRTVGPRDEE